MCLKVMEVFINVIELYFIISEKKTVRINFHCRFLFIVSRMMSIILFQSNGQDLSIITVKMVPSQIVTWIESGIGSVIESVKENVNGSERTAFVRLISMQILQI